jgi:hypothetical protein
MSAGVTERAMPVLIRQIRTPKACRESQSGFNRQISSTLMIADNDLADRKEPADSDRRRRHLFDGYAVQEAGLKRRSTISHPRVEPHDLASFGAASV